MWCRSTYILYDLGTLDRPTFQMIEASIFEAIEASLPETPESPIPTEPPLHETAVPEPPAERNRLAGMLEETRRESEKNNRSQPAERNRLADMLEETRRGDF